MLVPGNPARFLAGVLCALAVPPRTVKHTTTTNPGGRHLRRRAPAAARAKLSNQLKAIRMVSNTARVNALDIKEQVTHLVSEMTPSLLADIMEHWSTTCEENQVQEQLSEEGEHNEALTLLRAAARSKRQDISKMDDQEAKEAIAQAATRQRQQLFTNPRKARAIIFRKGVQMGRPLALLDSDTKRFTDHPRSMIRVVTTHFADAQKHPHGHETGTYLPGHANRSYPFAEPGADDRFHL